MCPWTVSGSSCSSAPPGPFAAPRYRGWYLPLRLEADRHTGRYDRRPWLSGGSPVAGVLDVPCGRHSLRRSHGLLDSSLNTAVALSGRNRLLNALHGCYGVGTTIGPLVVTAAILAVSWRPA